MSGIHEAALNDMSREGRSEGGEVNRDLCVMLRPRAAGLELQDRASTTSLDDDQAVHAPRTISCGRPGARNENGTS